MYQVANWLEDADVALSGWDGKRRAVVPGCANVRRLDSYDLALLLTIAYRQHDDEPEGVWKDEECFCIGSKPNLAALARMGVSKFEESRAFLQAMKLITYKEHENDCLDLTDPKRRRQYDSVYRLNKAAFGMLRPTCHASGAHLPHKCRPLATQVVPTCQASAEYTYNNTNNSSINMGAVAAADADSVSNKLAEHYRRYIKQKWSLTEKQALNIGIEGLAKGIAGKSHDRIIGVINAFANDNRIQAEKIPSLAGSLVNALKKLPSTNEAQPSPEELERQFDPNLVQPQLSEKERRKAAFNDGFERLSREQYLDEVSNDQAVKIEKAYSKAFGGLKIDRMTHAINGFFAKLPEPDDDVSARCAEILSALKVAEGEAERPL